MKFNLKFEEVTNLTERTEKYEDKCFNALEAYARISSKDLEGKARKNAKWTDRTGQARKSITGTGERTDDNVSIILEGYATQEGKEYFQYLELCHKKKNAILFPTIEENKEDVLNGYAKVISKVEL